MKSRCIMSTWVSRYEYAYNQSLADVKKRAKTDLKTKTSKSLDSKMVYCLK